jgi:hypothetical protein
MTTTTFLVTLACPVCTYNRVMPTWMFFATLRLLLVLAVSYRRLDLIRTLGAFLLFEVGYYYAWMLAVWYSHPAVTEGLVEWFALTFFIALSIGIPSAIFLWGLSRVPYFRGKQTIVLTRKRTLLLLPVMFLLAVIQGL